jgi:hypothetical protein
LAYHGDDPFDDLGHASDTVSVAGISGPVWILSTWDFGLNEVAYRTSTGACVAAEQSGQLVGKPGCATGTPTVARALTAVHIPGHGTNVIGDGPAGRSAAIISDYTYDSASPSDIPGVADRSFWSTLNSGMKGPTTVYTMAPGSNVIGSSTFLPRALERTPATD